MTDQTGYGGVVDGGTLTLVATAGASNANSYVTVADADTILVGYLSYVTSGWDDNADDKAAALVQATRDIDSLRLSGGKYSADDEGHDDYQALHFPTTEDENSDGDLYIPAAVERATALQAAHILRVGEAAQATKDGLMAGIRSRGAGRFAETYDSARAQRVCQMAIDEIKKWVITSIRIDRG